MLSIFGFFFDCCLSTVSDILFEGSEMESVLKLLFTTAGLLLLVIGVHIGTGRFDCSLLLLWQFFTINMLEARGMFLQWISE